MYYLIPHKTTIWVLFVNIVCCCFPCNKKFICGWCSSQLIEKKSAPKYQIRNTLLNAAYNSLPVLGSNWRLPAWQSDVSRIVVCGFWYKIICTKVPQTCIFAHLILYLWSFPYQIKPNGAFSIKFKVTPELQRNNSFSQMSVHVSILTS